jgi:hypothetical protein
MVILLLKKQGIIDIEVFVQLYEGLFKILVIILMVEVKVKVHLL